MSKDLEKMSLEELKALETDVKKAIAGFEARRRKEARAEMEKVAANFGMTVSEVLAETKRGKKTASPAKYRNPSDPTQTWTGRGRQPAWFKAAIQAGKSEDDLAI